MNILHDDIKGLEKLAVDINPKLYEKQRQEEDFEKKIDRDYNKELYHQSKMSRTWFNQLLRYKYKYDFNIQLFQNFAKRLKKAEDEYKESCSKYDNNYLENNFSAQKEFNEIYNFKN